MRGSFSLQAAYLSSDHSFVVALRIPRRYNELDVEQRWTCDAGSRRTL